MEDVYNKYSSKTNVKGNAAEQLFKQRCIDNGLYIKDSTLSENKYKKCDIWVGTNKDNIVAIDVKDVKCVRRGETPSDIYNVVEYINGYNKPGWLKSNGFIAFKNNDDKFYIVSKQELYKLAKSKITDKTIYPTSSVYKLDNIAYKCFRRRSNQYEIISYVLWSDIKAISKKVI